MCATYRCGTFLTRNLENVLDKICLKPLKRGTSRERLRSHGPKGLRMIRYSKNENCENVFGPEKLQYHTYRIHESLPKKIITGYIGKRRTEYVIQIIKNMNKGK